MGKAARPPAVADMRSAPSGDGGEEEERSMALLDRILGRSLASEEEEQQKIGVLAGVPMLGLDALSSSAYGPEAALTLLLPLGALGLRYIGPIILVILAILAILYFSYR